MNVKLLLFAFCIKGFVYCESVPSNTFTVRKVYDNTVVKQGWISGFCIMAMHLPTQHFLKAVFGQITYASVETYIAFMS
jgi:hypothetical protein